MWPKLFSHLAPIGLNKCGLYHDVLTRRVTHLIFTPCDRRFDDNGNWLLHEQTKTMAPLISGVKKKILKEETYARPKKWSDFEVRPVMYSAGKVVRPWSNRPDRRWRHCLLSFTLWGTPHWKGRKSRYPHRYIFPIVPVFRHTPSSAYFRPKKSFDILL